MGRVQNSRRKPKRLPSVAYLRQCFSYDKSTGVLTWRVRPLSHFPDQRTCNIWNTRYSGTAAGSKRKNGYMHLKLLDKYWFVHRVIWKLVTEKDPGTKEVDHRNLNKTDNRWQNLRLATRSQNASNIPGRADFGKGLRLVDGNIEARIICDSKLYRRRFALVDLPKARKWIHSMRTQLHGSFSRVST